MSEEIRKKYLPIGTVVLLRNGKKRVMITGFCAVTKQDNKEKIWDYTGCIYPEGNVSANQICLFNHKQIIKIYHLGLENDAEEKSFKKKLNAAMRERKINKEDSVK